MTATTSRESYRAELAALLDLDPAILSDDTALREELALDSLAMMRLLTWMEGHGVTIVSDAACPATVGEALGMLDKAALSKISIQMNGAPPKVHSGLMPARPAKPRVDPLAPVMAAAGLRLAVIGPDDMGFLYALAAEPETSYRWRYRGAPPPPDRFASELWQQTLVQYLVRRTADGKPVGHVVAYAADLSLRHAYVGAVFLPEHTGAGTAAQCVALFVRHLFHTFPLRKLYMDIPGYNWPQMQSGQGRLFQVEGVQRDHDYYAGRYWDRYLCAIYPDRPLSEDTP